MGKRLFEKCIGSNVLSCFVSGNKSEYTSVEEEVK